MSIKVLLADDSEIMRAAIERLLKEESIVELVGEATSFAQAMEMTVALRPNVLVLDLYMHDNHECPPSIVESCMSQHDVCVLAISLSNDEKAKALAENFGAKALLDKADLFSALLPAIKRLCQDAPKTRSREKRLRHVTRITDRSQADTAS
jgi:NarL family two-component system response regulator LiaR